MRSFAEGNADTIGRMRRLVADGDLQSAAREAHTLKGCSGQIDAAGVGSAAKAVEQALKDGDVASALRLIADLDAALSPLLEGLAGALGGMAA